MLTHREFLTEKELAELAELIDDAERCPRLDKFEIGFMANMRRGVATYGDRFAPSDKQRDMLRKIQKKVYAT